jgi:peptidyl-prolyl cis-trans isomerase D
MFKFVENNKVVIQIILGAVALTFVGFGVSSYSSAVDDPYLVKIGDAKIAVRDLDRELNGQPVDAASRQRALEGLIQRELLTSGARGSGLIVSPSQLQQAIASIPQFQDNGQFSLEKYKAFLSERQMTGPQFEARISRDLLVQSQLSPFTAGQIVSREMTSRMAAILGEARVVRALVLTPQSFASQVKTDDAAVSAYYKANAARFKLPETVRVAYTVMSQDQLAQNISVSPDEVQKYFQQHQAEFGTEQRRASHILLMVAKGAPAQEQQRVKAQAEALLKQVQANPSSFAQLARSNSQDPGSAEKGGDLGFFARGAMVKPFDDAVFNMKPGQVSGLVKSDYGYHIIRLDQIRQPDLESVKPQVEQRIKLQKAASTFRSKVESMTEIAYQQGDSLKGVADALKLNIQQSGWISRAKPGADPVLSNPKVLAAAFSNDVLQQKHNSEPIDLGNNAMVVLRVTDHQAAHQPRLEEVRETIKAELIASEGAKLAAARGQALLAALKSGKGADAAGWSAPHPVSRQGNSGLPAADMRAVFAADVGKLPAFAGVKHDAGEYVVYRVDQVIAAPAVTAEQRTQLAGIIAQMNANAQAMSYLTVLRQKYPVKAGKQTLSQTTQDE